MNVAEKNRRIKENWFHYHIPGQSGIYRVKRNVIFISKANNIEHEKMKVDLAFEHSDFLTEAERVASADEVEIFKLKKGNKRVDFVDLVTGIEIEIINKHENDFQIKFYRGTGVVPMIVGETIICSVCKEKYPKRNKGEICQVCK